MKANAISTITTFAATVALCILTSCDSRPASGTGTGSPANDNREAKGNSQLSFKINGIEWKADSGIFGAFHPPGYNKAILIGGNKGSGKTQEQAFNINLYNTAGPGTYHIRSGNPDFSTAQMLDSRKPDTPMYGGQMDFDITVVVTKASNSPTIVEATFEGTLTANPGDVLAISGGKFAYHE